MDEGRDENEVLAHGEADNEAAERGPGDQQSTMGTPHLEGPPFRYDDPARMHLTDQERQWALSIKAAIDTNDEIDSLSDYTCAQLAISFQDDVDGAMESAVRRQGFREENDIMDTLSDSRRALAKLIKLFPRFYLAYSFNKEDGNYYFVYDVAQFTDSVMTRTEMYTTWAASHYYLCHAWSVDFELMRKGIIVLAECAGYKWSRCNDIKVVEKVWMELLWSYHVKVQTAKHFNTSVMHNVFLSMLKGVLPTRLKSMFDTGYRSDNRLDEYYLVPSVEAANQRLLASLDFVLERRYNLEQSFSLSLPNE